MSAIQTQIQKTGCSGWVDWGETLIACYPLYDEVVVGDCYCVITDYDYVMKLTPPCDLRLKLKVKQAKIPLYMIIHNEDFYYSFDMRNSSNSGRMNYCDSLRITRYGSEFESDFKDKGLKDSIEVRQIFLLLDQIQLILETIKPSLKTIVSRIQPRGVRCNGFS